MRSLWFAVLLAGCGTTAVPPLAYAPLHPLQSPDRKPVLALLSVTDERHQDARWVGTAEGDTGTPTRTLATTGPAAAQVSQAFIGAMLGRGLLAPAGKQRFDLSVAMVRLDGSQRLGLSGRAEFTLTVARHDSGRVVYRDSVTTQVNGRAFPSLDTLAFVPTGDVARATSEAMSQAIDAALDRPAFRAAVQL